ncbi:MAG: hypothetical protein KDB22_05070 [Planctomycetales bacterium]|nr:hypothetical protein [Planctomycetales bacterium]
MNYIERIADEWRQRAGELAEWTMRCMVNRTDVWGRYVAKKYRETEEGKKNHAITAPFRDERGKVFLNTASLEKHFRTQLVSGVLGLHSTSTDLSSRWLAIDIDLHDEDELSVTAEGNFVAARHWYGQLCERGFDPLLLDSNGKGGFHLLVIFEAPMSTHDVNRFGLQLVSDFAMRGLDRAPEIFPGKPQWHHYGDWLRLPGRHHTHDHYSRVYCDEAWADDQWLDGHDAIDRILATRLADATVCADAGIQQTRRTICLDFDGVIHSYRSGWCGIESIPDPPIHGTDRAIERLRQEYRVVVHSARCATQAGREAIENWLLKHQIVVDEVCEHKPPAMVYIDDRAIRFQGDWSNAIAELRQFRK